MRIRASLFLLPILIALSSFAPSPFAAISVTTLSPATNAVISSDSLIVLIRIRSTFDIQDVRAQVGDVDRPMLSGFYCFERSGCNPGFRAAIPLQGESSGPKEVRITAKDVQGEEFKTSIPFINLRVPTGLTVESPLQHEVAVPVLRFKAHCLHDSITTCKVSVLIDPGYDKGRILISSPESIDTTLDMSLLDRSQGGATFTACDGFKTCTSEYRDYKVENSAHLVLWRASQPSPHFRNSQDTQDFSKYGLLS